jgi:hypothetical protein
MRSPSLVKYTALNPQNVEIRLLTLLPPLPEPAPAEPSSSTISLPAHSGQRPAVQSATRQEKAWEAGPNDPRDKAVAELIKLGFSVEQARYALTENGRGVNMQAAVDWLLKNPKQENLGQDQNRLSKVKELERKPDFITPSLSTSMLNIQELIESMLKIRLEAEKVEGEYIEGIKDVPRCVLKTVSLKKKPFYVALSYTWGDPTFSRLLNVDNSNIDVTANLEQAVQAIRKELPRTLWVDALCINQNDNAEKGHQVGMMKDIYENAASVLVWLGPSAYDSDAVMTMLDSFGKQALDAGIMDIKGEDLTKLRSPGLETNLPPALATIKRSVDTISDKVGFDFPFVALMHFSKRPYWKRVWITQEVCVAKRVTILCGAKELPFEHFAAGIIFIEWHRARMWVTNGAKAMFDPLRGPMLISMMNAEGDGADATLIGARRKYQRGTNSRDNLLTLLTRSCIGHTYLASQRATDNRDIVYGILGMASDEKQLAIQVDYEKTTQQVYIDVTRALFKCGHTNILAWSQQPKLVQGLPSWVPDFSSPIRAFCNEDKFRPLALFSASGTQPNPFLLPHPTTHSTNGLNVLALKCCRVDTVARLGSIWGASPDLNEEVAALTYLDEIKAFCDLRPTPTNLASSGSEPSNDFSKWASAYWRIPTADQEYTGTRVRASSSLFPAYNEFVAYLRGSISNNLSPEKLVKKSDEANFYKLNLLYQSKQRPFLSKGKYVGLVPEAARVDDEVVLVAGARTPFLIRRADDGLCELIGEAYVDGIMDGEFVRRGPPPGSVEILHLR